MIKEEGRERKMKERERLRIRVMDGKRKQQDDEEMLARYKWNRKGERKIKW